MTRSGAVPSRRVVVVTFIRHEFRISSVATKVTTTRIWESG